MVLYFKWRHNTSYRKFSFNSVKGIHLKNGENVCAIYVNLLHNYSKSDCYKFEKLQ